MTGTEATTLRELVGILSLDAIKNESERWASSITGRTTAEQKYKLSGMLWDILNDLKLQ